MHRSRLLTGFFQLGVVGIYDNLEYSNSAELCECMAEECDTALLAFSTGKDSIASWLQLKRYFKHIIPYYKYHVPRLQFVEDSLKYYEDFFQTRIYRLPSPALIRWISYFVHQTPDRSEYIIENMQMSRAEYNNDVIADILRFNLGLDENVYSGIGVRMADSPMRRVSIVRYGAINHTKKSFYPIYDWVKDDILREIDSAGVKLPPDYIVFGNTFDGITYKYLKPMKEYYPEDYERLIQWFPLAELEIARYEGLGAINAKR